jgi:hypothetical protein
MAAEIERLTAEVERLRAEVAGIEFEYGVRWEWTAGERGEDWYRTEAEARENFHPGFDFERVHLIRRPVAGPVEVVASSEPIADATGDETEAGDA